MKIKEIYIKDFRQFKDFHLDLTYPKGHAKEGQPLEKVCFIGQSGTGKTTLLNLIHFFSNPVKKESGKLIGAKENVCFKLTDSKDDYYAFFYDEIDESISKIVKESNIKKASDILQFDTRKFLKDKSITYYVSDRKNYSAYKEQKKLKTIFLPANLNYEHKEDTLETQSSDNQLDFDFAEENIYTTWSLILDKITKFQEDELKLRQDISKVAEIGNFKELEKQLEKLKNWKQEHFNPIRDIAHNCINALIKPFGLRVKEDLDIQKKEDIGFIKIEDFQGNEVPFSFWSTGTKQVILSAMALYLIKPENSIIFFDEPERSLYPDLQRIIINHYQNLTKNSQLFFATHSPIIASSFEPWEIVELKFDDKYHVYREKYYEGENHVDNYFIDPRFLNFDMVLKKVFDMEDTNSDLRYEALAEYAMLKNQLNKLKADNKLQSEEAKKIYEDFKALSKKLAVNPEQYAAT